MPKELSMANRAATFCSLHKDEMITILNFLDIESLYRLRLVNKMSYDMVDRFCDLFVKKVCPLPEDGTSIEAFRWVIQRAQLEELNLGFLLYDEAGAKYLRSKLLTWTQDYPIFGILYDPDFINLCMPSLKILNLSGLSIRARHLCTIFQTCKNLQFIDCTFCKYVTYEHVLWLKYFIPNCTMRRLPQWLTGDVRVPWAENEIHTYYIDGSFSYSRGAQARGFIRLLVPGIDCVRDSLQYIDFPFSPEIQTSSCGVLARHWGPNHIQIAQINPHAAISQEILVYPSIFPRETSPEHPQIDVMPVSGLRDQHPPEDLQKEIYRWFCILYKKHGIEAPDHFKNLYDIQTCPLTIYEQFSGYILS